MQFLRHGVLSKPSRCWGHSVAACSVAAPARSPSCYGVAEQLLQQLSTSVNVSVGSRLKGGCCVPSNASSSCFPHAMRRGVLKESWEGGDAALLQNHKEQMNDLACSLNNLIQASAPRALLVGLNNNEAGGKTCP